MRRSVLMFAVAPAAAACALASPSQITPPPERTITCAPPDDPDHAGFPRCFDGMDRSVIPHIDATGAVAIRNEQGSLVYGQTNQFGTTTFYPPPESYAPVRYQAFPDGIGGVILRDDAGGVISAPVDPMGNVTINDGDGRVLRCWVDPVGVAHCD